MKGSKESLWFICTLLFFLLLAISGRSWIIKANTITAPGFNEAAFHRVQPGASRATVIAMLGPPLSVHRSAEAWKFEAQSEGAVVLLFEHIEPRFPEQGVCMQFYDGDMRILRRADVPAPYFACLGKSKTETIASLGSPDQILSPSPVPEIWQYSRNGSMIKYRRFEEIFDPVTGCVSSTSVRMSSD